MDLHSIRFLSAFERFFLLEKVRFFSSTFLHATASPALTRLSHTEQKFSKKKFVKGYIPILKYRFHCSYTKFFEQNFYQYVTVCLVRVCSYKNADKEVHTKFHGEAKT